jgi:imidazolonepropionase
MSRSDPQFSAEHIRRTSAPSLEYQAKRLLVAFMRHGTTTVEIKSGFGLDESGELKMFRVMSHLADAGFNIVPTFMAPYTPPAEFAGSETEYFNWVCDHLLPKIKSRNVARFVDGFCDTSGINSAQANALLTTARRLGFATKLHVEHSTRMGCMKMAVEMGAVSVEGLNHTDYSDASVLAQSRTVGVVMPGPMHMGHVSRFAPARELIDRGAAVALASGFHPPVVSTYNMMTVITLACTHLSLTPEEAITAATINGAHAVNQASSVGSLEFGKQADLIMLNVSDYREIPYHFGVNLVALTMRKGQAVYKEGAVAWDGE